MSILGWSNPRLADIDTDWNARPAARCMKSLKARGHCFAPLIVESESIDEGLVVRVAEEAWLRITRLGKSRHRADLGESEAERLPGWEGERILIQPGSESDGIRKGDPGNGTGCCGNGFSCRRSDQTRPYRNLRSGLQHCQHSVMGLLGIEGKENRAKQSRVNVHGRLKLYSPRLCVSARAKPPAPSF